MTRLEVTTDRFPEWAPGTILVDAKLIPEEWSHEPMWRVPLGEDGYFNFFPSEVILLPDAKHRGHYDPQHPGELEPDAYDRMSYKYDDHGRHLLHTGTE